MDNVPPTGPATPPPTSSQDTDRLLAAATYPIPIIGLVVLLTDMKNRQPLRLHAVQSLVAGVALWVIAFLVGLIPVIGWALACILPFLVLGITLYWAYQVYQGKTLVIPFVTDFVKQQGWA